MIAECEFGVNRSEHLTFPLTLQDGTRRDRPRHWGTDVKEGQPCTKGSLTTVRTLVFHVDHTAANTRVKTTRKRLRQMVLDCAKYQVDFEGGDCNASLHIQLLQ